MNERAFYREYLRRLKVEMGCVDCGYNAHSEALHFDHMPPYEKTFEISKFDRYLDELFDELEKCEVVCANCHAIRSANRRERVTLRTAEELFAYRERLFVAQEKVGRVLTQERVTQNE